MSENVKDVVAHNAAPSSPGQMEKPSPALPKILEMAARTGSLHLQRVRCSKKTCKCSRGQPHEGYYFFWSTRSGVVKRYVRRADVPLVREVIEGRTRSLAQLRSELGQATAMLKRLMATLR